MRVEIRSNSAVIEGYVNVVERESRMLRDSHGEFIEIVKAGTFAKAIKNNDNVELRFNHNRHLGDVKSGSLELREDDIGLFARALVEDKEVIEKARNKEFRGWSFGFSCRNAEWEEAKTSDDSVMRKRKLTDIELREVSILDKTPAYIATSIEMRDDKEDLVEFRSAPNEEIEVIEEKREKKDDPSSFFAEIDKKYMEIKGGNNE